MNRDLQVNRTILAQRHHHSTALQTKRKHNRDGFATKAIAAALCIAGLCCVVIADVGRRRGFCIAVGSCCVIVSDVLQDESDLRSMHRNMEANAASQEHEDQDEYVLLDLDGVSDLIDFPPNANYVLTGLDTLNPVLIIEDKFKLIGEYEETIGTCLAFTEQDAPLVHEETGTSEVNIFSGTRLFDSSQPPTKQVKPVCQLHKVLKFKLSPDSEIQNITVEEAK